MQIFEFPLKSKKNILALGAESTGNFSVYKNNKIYFSKDFDDLLDDNNFDNFKKSVLNFLKKKKIKPDIIITDLHPLMKTTLWGEELAKKYKAELIQTQHHHAHIFSAIGDKLLQVASYELPATSYGIAMDGTGYGTDEKIWGGEVFKLKMKNEKLKIVERIGSLENHIMLGGELAIREPARILLSILNKFLDKNAVYPYMETFYSPNEFELLYNQLNQNFNCTETSSTGRILDAVSLLLGFCKNERKYKHEPIDLLEKNSTKPYTNLEPKIIKTSTTSYELQTTLLFEYLIKNLHKDKKRLATTAQLYIARGFNEIIKKSSLISHQSCSNNQLFSNFHPELDSGYPIIFASGGITNNKIISDYFASKNIYLNRTIPRGDAGLSFGQIIYFLLNK